MALETSTLMEIDREESAPITVKEPPKIHRLDESVVNRIAAGEVIQRPVSAIKELVENSLDANSTSINVVVKDGGLKLIQVSDDGHGIRYEDLPILCERHTTSKLSTFEDLHSIKSMGFRGEALASMTYVSHVTVTTITQGQLHGYRASYRDGMMENEPKACAAVKGTQIMIENLFYNMTARKKTLQNSGDDYPKIVDLLSRFAIHHINVSFSCRKHGAPRADVHSVASSSKIDAIRSVYGVSVAQNLMAIEASDDDLSSSVFEMNGLISDSNYIAKKITMVLFINDRLVECGALKRAIEIVYSATLPKASKPFIYMSLVLPSEHVDVNVHPTKREVSLLNQEVIIEKIQAVVESKLRNSNEGRTFQEQTVDPSPSSPMTASQASPSIPSTSASGFKVPKAPNKIVRTDSQDPAGRLHAYMQVKSPVHVERNNALASVRSLVRRRRNPRETADLTSIQELLNDINHRCHSGLLDIVKDCTYIGMADDVFALLQHNTHLYLANVVNLSKELMYQQVLRRFAHFNAIQLSDPAPLPELILLALKEEDLDANGNDDLKKKIAEMNTDLLKQKSELLDEYFCIHVDAQGNLGRLPVILDQYTPEMDRVPEFVLCLGNDIDWEDEKTCFQSIAAALGNFYAMHPPLLPNPAGEGLQFYKRKPSRNSEEPDSTSLDLMDIEVPPFAANAGPSVSLAQELSGSKTKRSKNPNPPNKVHSQQAPPASEAHAKRKFPDGSARPESTIPPKVPRKHKEVAFSSVGNSFAKLAEEHVGANDLKSWSDLRGARADEEMNHLVSKLFFLQLSRSDEVQEQAAALKSSKEEIQNLQGSMAKKDEELATLRKLVKDQVDEAEKSEAFWKKANEDLVAAANKQALEFHDDLRLARDTLEEARQKLEEQTANLEAATQRSFAEGTVNFFKSFMKTLPDFDWSPFGVATVDYAARMKVQMAEEAKTATELETRPEGETVPETEARQAEEVDGDRTSEQTADVATTDAA